jgi:phospholipid/cholesterol/gamma-HCH transport system substrate-binding protein
MPSQQEVRWSQLKVGVIVLVSFVVLTALLFLMTSASGLGFFTRKLTVDSYFQNASGVKVGAAVNLEGVTIGTVKTVTVVTAPDRKLTPVQVVMKIDGKYQPNLHTDSRASLTTVGVLGDTIVDIDSRTATGPMLHDGDELKAKEALSLQDVEAEGADAIKQLNGILAKLNTVVDNIQQGKGSIGQFITNPGLYNKVDATMDEVHKLTVKMNSNNNTVGKFFDDNAALYNQLNDTVAKVDAIVGDIQAGKGNAGKLLKDQALYDNLNQSSAHINSILANADAGKGGLGVALKDPKFAKDLGETLTQMDELITGINHGKGTLGKLANDPTTHDNVNKLLTSTSDLVTAIRQNPKKYLTIQLKIF